MKFLLFYVAILVLSVSFVSTHVFAAGSNQNPADGANQNPADGANQNPATTCGTNGQSCLTNPLDSSISTIPAFFGAIIDIVLVFAIPFVVFFIIYAGFLYVTARGNAETIKKAHNALLYALIGGLLILGSRTLLTIITNTVNQLK